jgi:hypothetical protein
MTGMDGPAFTFAGELWEAEAVDPWVFVTVPVELGDEVRAAVAPSRGFGTVRVRVTIGGTTWDTSVFPDSKLGAFLLPVKRSVRDAECIDVGDRVEVTLVVRPG